MQAQSNHQQLWPNPLLAGIKQSAALKLKPTLWRIWWVFVFNFGKLLKVNMLIVLCFARLNSKNANDKAVDIAKKRLSFHLPRCGCDVPQSRELHYLMIKVKYALQGEYGQIMMLAAIKV